MSWNGIASTEEFRTLEYYLLYYGEWVWSEDQNDHAPNLTYCVKIGKLPEHIANSIAMEHEINHDSLKGEYVPFHGFTSNMDEIHEPYYVIKSRQSLHQFVQIHCAKAMAHFDEVVASGEIDEAIKFMQKICKIAEKFRKEFSSDDVAESTTKTAIPAPPPPKPTSTDQKCDPRYEEFVEILVDQSIAEVLAEKAQTIISAKEIVSRIKESENFFPGKMPKDASILKGIHRTSAWKTREEKLVAARKKKGFGMLFETMRRNDKHHNRKNMAPYQDVNSDGDGYDN